MPLKYKSPSQVDVVYHVKALAPVYTAASSIGATKSYLQGLQTIYKLSGKAFEEVLQEELSKLSKSAISPSPDKTLSHYAETSPESEDLAPAQPYESGNMPHSAPPTTQNLTNHISSH